MKLLVSLIAALILAAPAAAELKPEPHPSAKGKKVTTSWAYDYWITGVWTIDGVKTKVRVKCHVNRKGRHTCKTEVPA